MVVDNCNVRTVYSVGATLVWLIKTLAILFMTRPLVRLSLCACCEYTVVVSIEEPSFKGPGCLLHFGCGSTLRKVPCRSGGVPEHATGSHHKLVGLPCWPVTIQLVVLILSAALPYQARLSLFETPFGTAPCRVYREIGM